jgi:DNA-binding NarL/FixJ family response regulator
VASPDTVRILVVGADPLARAALLTRLDRQRELEVVGETTPEETLESPAESDVLLWDLGLRPLDEVDTFRDVAARETPVMGLVADDTHAGTLLASGARGLLRRDAEGERLAAGLVALSRGLLAIDDEFAEALVRTGKDPFGTSALVEPLTRREQQVLELLALGLSNKAVAERLGVSEHTAKFHVNSILGKLGAENRTEAIVQAARLGLIVL